MRLTLSATRLFFAALALLTPVHAAAHQSPGRLTPFVLSHLFVNADHADAPANLIQAAAAQDGGDSQGRVRHPPNKAGSPPPTQGEPRAVPREEPKRTPEARPRDDRDRPPRTDRRDPPRRGDAPPHYFGAPHAFAFEPLDVRIGYYYHPYFGFYVGPYYGPFYPFPGPFAHSRFAVSSLRLKVKPVDTAVYLNGYYAGIVDDFDGLFQRLYVPAGNHHLELRLEGYERYAKDIYLAAGDSMDVAHQMTPLRPGMREDPLPPPGAVSDAWTPELHELGQPSSPYGILVIRTDPPDAEIHIDNDVWTSASDQRPLVIHMPAGSHRIEIRKAGHTPFVTTVDLRPGQSTPLNVQLER